MNEKLTRLKDNRTLPNPERPLCTGTLPGLSNCELSALKEDVYCVLFFKIETFEFIKFYQGVVHE